MQWKIYVLTYETVVTPSGNRTATAKMISDAQDALRNIFAKKASEYTDGKLTVDLTFAPTIPKITPTYAYTSEWFPRWTETRTELDKLPWNAYDAIIVLADYIGGPDATKLYGQGVYAPEVARGAAYATIPLTGDPKKCDADLIMHEFLHGACEFFQRQGYSMPVGKDGKQGDGVHVGGDYYPELGVDPATGADRCYSLFYRDLMRGESKPFRNQGIPLAAWELGTPRNIDALAGRGSTDGAGFRTAFATLLPAWSVTDSGRPDARAYAADGGERQLFGTPDGDAAILKGSGLTPYAVKPKVWAALKGAGGPAALGFPLNALHDWSTGKVQDFRKGTASAAIMQPASGDARVVQPAIWSAFIGAGGAPSLGFPTNDLHEWGLGKLQDFTGSSGAAAVMQGTGRGAYPVLPKIWSAFVGGGGAPALGYPDGTLHDWGSGKIQDFSLSSDWKSGVMQATGATQAYVVKGVIWRHYTSKGGATSYLGYPTSNEYTGTAGGKTYWMQNFVGGKIRVDQSTQKAEDYR